MSGNDHSHATPSEESERTLFMRWWDKFRHTIGDEEAESYAAWRAWLERGSLSSSAVGENETPECPKGQDALVAGPAANGASGFKPERCASEETLTSSKQDTCQSIRETLTPDESNRQHFAPSETAPTDRDEIIEECAKVAMDMPLKSGEERHSYRWTDTYKSAAWDIAHAIRALKNAAPQVAPSACQSDAGSAQAGQASPAVAAPVAVASEGDTADRTSCDWPAAEARLRAGLREKTADSPAVAAPVASSTAAVGSGETPRTDAEEMVDSLHWEQEHNFNGPMVVPAEFARQLERELAVANENRLLQADAIRDYEREIAQLRHDLERAAELLRRYAAVVRDCHSHELERFDYLPEIEDAAETVADVARSSTKVESVPAEPVRDEVGRFAVLMERELKANDHKDHWSNCGMSYLLKRLREEVVELEEPLLATSAPQPADIASEAADVANFAMMIADNAKALPRGNLTRSAKGGNEKP